MREGEDCGLKIAAMQLSQAGWTKGLGQSNLNEGAGPKWMGQGGRDVLPTLSES